MKRFHVIAIAAVIASSCGVASVAPALARPPTVTVSPGYDQRLIESRKALQAAQTYPAPSRRVRHRHHIRPN